MVKAARYQRGTETVKALPLEFEETPDPNVENTYQSLPSVWHGEDAELLEEMLNFYPRQPPRLVLDATLNAGRFWRGTTRTIVGLDIDESHKPDIRGDNSRM